MAHAVTAQTFDQEVVKSSLPVVVDVYATWCGPCKMMMPIFEELAKELGEKYKCVSINIDEERDIAIQYNVSSIPTFLFFKAGKLVAKESGYMNKEALKTKIETHLG
jgi:thioredoxin 1